MADDSLMGLRPIAAQPNNIVFDALQQKLSGVAEGGGPIGDNRMLEASRDFEAMLVTQMLQIMRESVPDGGLFEKDAGRDTYYQLMDMELGQQIAQTGTMGLADMLYRQLSRKADAAPAGQQTGEKVEFVVNKQQGV